MTDPTRLRSAVLASVVALLSACATVAPPAETPAPVVVVPVEPAPVMAEAPAAAPAAPLPEAQPQATVVAPVVVQEPAPAPMARPNPDAGLNLLLAEASRGDLWARVRAGYGMPDLDNELVRKWEQYYAQRPDYVQRMTARGARYLWHIVEEIDRRGMPSDLALLPFIESAFDPQALSVARAAGMWQFMPGTGRDFELKQNLFRDDRRDIVASTRAALDYLQKLHGLFDDWHLALAAYNWGQGNVLRAQARNTKARQGTGYLDLRMPDETRNYVPKLQAIKNIIAQPDAFGLVLPPLEDHPYFVSVPIERDIDIALAARLSGLTLDQFRQLNPQHNKPVILAAGTPQVLLPFDNASRFAAGLASHEGPLASWTAWVAPRTVRAQEAARQVGMTEEQLREVNRIPARMLVRAGSTLLVPRSAEQTRDVTEAVADRATIALTPEARPPRRLQVKVGQQPMSVAAMARRHGMTAAALAAANGVAVNTSFRPGQLVTVLVPHRPAAATRPAARKPAAGSSGQRAARPAAGARPPAR